MTDEYDIMNECLCTYADAQEILKERQAKEEQEAAMKAAQEPTVEQVIEMLERKCAAQTLLRVGPTEDMINVGVTANRCFLTMSHDSLVRYVWDVMLKEATK